jgi:hypothetical protein
MTRKLLAAALLALPPFIAQVVPVKGDRSLTLFGNGSSDDDFSTTAFGASGDLGYSVTDSRDTGVRQDVNLVELENDSRWNGTTSVFYDLEFISLKRSGHISARVWVMNMVMASMNHSSEVQRLDCRST